MVLPNLHLENIVPENAGNYTCVGMNKGGTASSSGFLVVYGKLLSSFLPLKSISFKRQTPNKEFILLVTLIYASHRFKRLKFEPWKDF